MRKLTARLVASLATLFLALPSASAQIKWNVTYQDQVLDNGLGFDSEVIFSGSLTHGQARRDSVQAALAYLGTQLDGRGTTDLTFNQSQTDGTGSLASFGAGQIAGIPGSFQNGGVYQAARTNNRPFPGEGPDGQGVFDFGYAWNYAGQDVNPNNYDMVTVAIHEVTHGLGFSSFLKATGQGLMNSPVGTPDIYSGYARHLQRGNGTGGSLFNTDLTSANYGSFTGPLDTLTNGNDPTTGLFFGGQYAREVFGGAVPIHAPNPFNPGSSTSHVSDGNAVMNPNIAPNVVKRYLRYEVAMLMDFGWNVYNWDNASGNWKDGVTGIPPNETYTVNNSNWRTDVGIVYDGSQVYNIHSDPDPAPVLPPYAQVTSNIVLNFGGSGGSGYTSTNDLGDVRISRLNLNSSSSATNTINNAVANPNARLIFGLNSDGTASVLTPKIVQQNAGAFAIDTNIEITNTTGALGGGWTGLTVDGPGTGQVTLGGVISGTGALTKAGSFTLQLAGASANTFTGVTTVQAGTLLLSKTPGRDAMGGDLTITGGTARLGAADQLPSTGTTTPVVTLAGGTLSTGSGVGFGDIAGAFEMTSASTIALGSGSHALRFTGFKDDSLAGALTVTGWTVTEGGPPSGGRLYFSTVSGDPNATYAGWLTTVQFDGFAQGAFFVLTDLPQTYELTPVPIVPEPAAILALAAGALGFATLIRRFAFVRAFARSQHGTSAPA